MNKIFLPVFLFVLTVSFSVFALIKGGKSDYQSPSKADNQTISGSSQTEDKKSSEKILFYGDGCPHCANVEAFLEKNPAIAGKANLVRKEVYRNENNAQEMSLIAQKCGLNSSSIGVPFFWNGENCLMGDTPIINYLERYLEKTQQ